MSQLRRLWPEFEKCSLRFEFLSEADHRGSLSKPTLFGTSDVWPTPLVLTQAALVRGANQDYLKLRSFRFTELKPAKPIGFLATRCR